MRNSDCSSNPITLRVSALLTALLIALFSGMAFGHAHADGESAQAAPPYPLLTLVNRWHPLPDGFEPELVRIGDGNRVDARAAGDLERMLNDCRAAGLRPVVRSSYRTEDKQTALYKNKVQRLMNAGLQPFSARFEAATVVAYPGTSEHQLGLALDIVDYKYQALETDQEDTPVQQWLMANSWRYGFILRYPSDKRMQTGIIYEPWHYRYVGLAAAAEMQESRQCFEEYIAARIAPETAEVPLETAPVRHIYAPIASRF